MRISDWSSDVCSSDLHDACGVGFIASIDGKPRREVVTAAIAALQAVWHRGAVDADGKTGDGAGIHLAIPLDFVREHIEHTGHTLNEGRNAGGLVRSEERRIGKEGVRTGKSRRG